MITEESTLQAFMTTFVAPIITPIIQNAVREEVSRLHTVPPTLSPLQNRIGGIDLAMEVTHKAGSTIYNLVHQGKIPHSKVSGKLYFSEGELLDWIRQGKRKSTEDVNSEIDNFLGRRGERKQVA